MIEAPPGDLKRAETAFAAFLAYWPVTFPESGLPNLFIIECHVFKGQEINTVEKWSEKGQILTRGMQTDVQESSKR